MLTSHPDAPALLPPLIHIPKRSRSVRSNPVKYTNTRTQQAVYAAGRLFCTGVHGKYTTSGRHPPLLLVCLPPAAGGRFCHTQFCHDVLQPRFGDTPIASVRLLTLDCVAALLQPPRRLAIAMAIMFTVVLSRVGAACFPPRIRVRTSASARAPPLPQQPQLPRGAPAGARSADGLVVMNAPQLGLWLSFLRLCLRPGLVVSCVC